MLGETYGPPPEQSFPDPLHLFATRLEMIGKIEEYYRIVIKAAETTLIERDDLVEADQKFDAEITWKYHFLQTVLFQPMRRRIEHHDGFQLYRNATMTILALNVFQAETGQFPESLQDLPKDLLPIDPIDPYSGNWLGYYRDPDAPGGRGYLLYTAGRDGIDNGGKLYDENGYFHYILPKTLEFANGYDLPLNYVDWKVFELEGKEVNIK